MVVGRGNEVREEERRGEMKKTNEEDEGELGEMVRL